VTSRSLIGVVAALAAAAALAAGAPLAAQKSAERGVTVAVTPKNVGSDAREWEFAVALDTHTQELSDDFAKSAVLIDAKGERHAPVAWKGAPPGGHHRAGTLSFAPISPVPQSIELRIQRPGEPAPRSFRWELR
jgi:hypothetical protein